MRVAPVVVALAVLVHGALWYVTREQKSAPDFNGLVASISYDPHRGAENEGERKRPVTAEQIRSDLQIISRYTRNIRTYSSTGGGELVPAIANEFGLKVTLGAYLNGPVLADHLDDPALVARRKVAADDPDDPQLQNAREINAAIALARKNRNVIGVVVGNETIYRGELVLIGDDTVDPAALSKIKATINPTQRKAAIEGLLIGKLVKAIQGVKHEVNVPVTTGEIHSVWIDHPELASSVDFVAAHVLPYWERVPVRGAVDQAVAIYDNLRQAHPGKRVMLAEFGWPSAGYNRGASDPGRMEQAQVLRDFVVRADALGIDYNLIEATDQPWKTAEGSVGPYWGLFDANLQAKFSWVGPLVDPNHWKLAGIALLVGFLLSLPILAINCATAGQAALLSVAAHLVGTWTAIVFSYWNGHYFVPGAAFALTLGLILLVPLVAIALARIEEIAAIAFDDRPRRLLGAMAPSPGYAPKVSIHVPAYREPPEMLKQTLDALARLDYPNWEAIVVINNTPDPEFWRPIEEHCRTLGERFKFINAEKVDGFKAGALRLALAQTAPDAEVIGVIDADYAVHPDWLKDLAPTFADPRVGLVQAPQDHRDGDRTVLHHAMNSEYSGFFDIGMVERNEVNAIVVHGTMCLIRRAALDSAGGWPTDTITEDTDLGLSILEQGWLSHYTNRRYGHGLLPDTFEAYKKQRHRWAYGGFHIIKKHWRRFLPGGSRLTRDQRRQYALGWLNWLGAETIGVVVAILNLIWVPVVAFAGIAVPDKILTLPIIAAFTVALAHFISLYRLRVSITPAQTFAAALAAMALQWTVARAMFDGVVSDKLPFARTAKGGRVRVTAFQAFWEAVLGGLLLLGAAVLIVTNHEGVREINLFAAVLVVQSLPFLSAVLIAAIEGTRFNEFAYWTALRARLAELRMPRVRIARASKRVNTLP